MPNLTRRDLGKSLVTGAAAAAALPGATKRPLGFQLYTVRNLIPAHARETLQSLAQIGYREAELLPDSNDVTLPLCKEFGINPVSGHFLTPLVTGNFEPWKSDFPQGLPAGMSWQKAVDGAAQAGLWFMVIPYLMPGERSNASCHHRLMAALPTTRPSLVGWAALSLGEVWMASSA